MERRSSRDSGLSVILRSLTCGLRGSHGGDRHFAELQVRGVVALRADMDALRVTGLVDLP